MDGMLTDTPPQPKPADGAAALPAEAWRRELAAAGAWSEAGRPRRASSSAGSSMAAASSRRQASA
ncbi:hypothetical protein, partial [Halorhodospira neutriphila]|uniref:hypothetical protein n=1 Tax=Halorhodospira neutriphila TaxID=168379 RepID=UPI001903CD9B